jgi:hypothetical protein
MSLLEAINTYKQDVENLKSEGQLIAELTNKRLPALQSRLNANKHTVSRHNTEMHQALDDESYDAAKQSCQCAQVSYDDCAQMLKNTDNKIKAWPGVRQNLQYKVDSSRKVMWKIKESEVIASLPQPIPNELRIGLQKLISITRLNESMSDGFYGKLIDQIYGDAAHDELEGTKNELLTEMGL